MAKDMHLVNIYLKIHNKRPITMDDLRYLAKYSPECFEKTCKNVVYNRPDTKSVMEPNYATTAQTLQTSSEVSASTVPQPTHMDLSADKMAFSEHENITQILRNIALLETDAYPVSNLNAGEVRDLLGNLYMELLFPHNDRDTFFDMGYAFDYEAKPHFDRKA